VPSPDKPVSERVVAGLGDYLNVLWKRRWLIALIVVATVASAVVFTSLQTPVFEPAATVMIEPQPPKVGVIQDLVPVSESPDYYATQYKLIGSRPIVESAIKRLKLTDRVPGLSSARDPYRVVAGSLTVEPVKLTRLVLVKFADPDPVLAADVANGIANEYVRHNLELKNQIAQEATEWLNHQLATLKNQAQQSAKALQAFQSQADLVGLQEQRQITQAKIIDLNRAYLESQNQRLSIEAKLRELTRVARDPMAAESISLVADDPLIRKLKTEASDLQIERSKLAQISKEKHPDLVQLDAQIKQVNQRLHAEIQKLLRAVETEYNVAKTREANLLSNVNELRREARTLNEREAQALALQREKESTEDLQNAVLKRFKETGVATALEANNVRVVEPATPPAQPARPRKQLIWTLSVIAGVALGGGVAFLAENLDNRVRSPEDVERAVGLPILGIVPVFSSKRDG
jgi:succinoglycan biosynthesis transport protein ExoP